MHHHAHSSWWHRCARYKLGLRLPTTASVLQAASPSLQLTKRDTSAVSSRELYAGSGAELNKGDRKWGCGPGESTIPRESLQSRDNSFARQSAL